MEITVHQAGFDLERLGGLLKTHIDGEQLMLFWEMIDGRWTAVYAKSDSQEKIKAFMRKINKTAGRSIFDLPEERAPQAKAALSPIPAPPPVKQEPPVSEFPTNFRDGELLARTLQEFGLNQAGKAEHQPPVGGLLKPAVSFSDGPLPFI